MINHGWVGGVGSGWEPLVGPLFVLPAGTEFWARSEDGRARQGPWGRLLGTSPGVMAHSKGQDQASPWQHTGQGRGLNHVGGGGVSGDKGVPPAPTVRHSGTRSGSVAEGHVEIPKVWEVGTDEDAQAGAGVPSKGCSSALTDFQGTAAQCPNAAMGQELPCAPPTPTPPPPLQ